MQYTCPTETMRLSEFVEIFKDSLSEILEPKITELGDAYKTLSAQLENLINERKKRFREVMHENNIPESEWELQWLFLIFADFDQHQLKNKVAVIKTELDQVMNAYTLWRIAMGYVTNDNELDVDAARQFPVTNLLSGKIIKSGKNQKTNCPLHGEKTPSFFVYPDNTWYCYGCGKGGDVIKFVQDLEGVTFQQAVRRLTCEL